MENSNRTLPSNPFAEALVAAGCNNWAEVGRKLLQVPHPVSIADVLGRRLAVPLADSCWRGGHEFEVAVYPVLSGSPSWTVTPTRLAQQVSDQLFLELERAYRLGVQDGDGPAVGSAFGQMLDLPGANRKRQAAVVEGFISLLAQYAEKQAAAIAAAPRQFPGCLGHPAQSFDLPRDLIERAAVSASYPDLAEILLLELLKVADWPLLRTLRYPFIAALSCELKALSQKHPLYMDLGRPGREWLDKALASDGTTEQYGADELSDSP